MFKRAEILIVDDHEAIRSGIRSLLEARPQWHVCGEAVDGVDAIEKVKTLHPDVVLMDVSMPRMDGITAMRIVQHEVPPPLIIIVTQNDVISLRRESVNADDYVLKVHLHRDLVPAIERVLGSPRTARPGKGSSSVAAIPAPSARGGDELLQPQSTGLLAAIVDSSDDAIISKDLNGIVLSWNAAAERIFGYSADEMLGKSMIRLIPPERRDEEQLILTRVRNGERVPHFETVCVRKDGTHVEVSVTISPLRDSRGRVTGASKIARDITSRKQTERALAASEQRLRVIADDLEATVHERTHELERRNAEVVEQSEQLHELSSRLQQGQDEERRRIARELHDSAGQLLAVLRMNLGQARERAGNDAVRAIETSEQIVDQLDSEIRTMSYLLHPPSLDEGGLSGAIRWYARGLSERAGVEIALDVPQDFGRLPPEMEVALFRIVQECLGNVLRHSRSKTAVIRLSRDSQRVRLEVEDQGRGIPAETMAHLHRQRAGVGIAGIRERVRHFGGAMHIDSNESGTLVTVTFPVPDCSRSNTILE